ncbi:MAG: DUF6933 domain-containing protein [Myxococcota bacterium]
MIVLRCTRKLASRLTLTPGAEDLQPTARLGDWYAGVLNVGHQRFVHCVSEKSLLSVVLPARDVRQLPSRVPGAVASLLTRLGVPAAVVEAEVSAMLPVCVGLTRSRSVVGSLVELGREAAFRLSPGAPPTADVELALAAVPCLKLEPDAMPFRTAAALLGVRVANPEWRVLH